MSNDSVMLEFCEFLEKRMLAKDPRSGVELKRIGGRPGQYMVICIAGNGQQEAYEVNGFSAEWIKVYG